MNTFKLLACLLIITLVISCAGSKSLPTQYYQLFVDEKTNQQYQSTQSFFIDVTDIPESLKRQSIVSYKSNKTNLIISKTHLWAADLQELITQAIKASLKNQFPEASFYTSRKHINTTDYVISIEIHEFAGELGQEVSLDATWEIVEGKLHTTNLTNNLSSDSYTDYVIALSKMLEILSGQIASKVNSQKDNE